LKNAEERAETTVNILSIIYYYVYCNLMYVFTEHKHCTTCCTGQEFKSNMFVASISVTVITKTLFCATEIYVTHPSSKQILYNTSKRVRSDIEKCLARKSHLMDFSTPPTCFCAIPSVPHGNCWVI